MPRGKGAKSVIFHKWREEEKEYLREIAPGRYKKEIQELMNKKFNLELTEGQIKGIVARLKINTGLTGCFEAGKEPWNKGTKGLTKGNKTSFKKGQTPINYRPVGSERINIDGYTEIKVGDPRVWKLKHRVLYEKKFGKIPEGYNLIFADQNKQNFDFDNLILVNNKELIFMNRNKLIFKDKELTKTGNLIAKIAVKTRERKEE